MGIDCWAAAPDYLKLLADNGFKDYLVLPSAIPEAYPGDSREKFHEQAKSQGVKLGIWGWYITEYETDQFASMYVNAQLMRDFYQRMRDGALKSLSGGILVRDGGEPPQQHLHDVCLVPAPVEP